MSDRRPLMPKATAVWLVANTSLTFEQIASFCGLHVLEVKVIADDELMLDFFKLQSSVNVGRFYIHRLNRP